MGVKWVFAPCRQTELMQTFFVRVFCFCFVFLFFIRTRGITQRARSWGGWGGGGGGEGGGGTADSYDT